MYVVGSSGSGGRKVWAMFGGLYPIINSLKTIDDTTFKNTIETSLVNALAGIYIYQPQDVNRFFGSIDGEDENINILWKRVRTSERREATSSAFFGRAIWFFRDGIILNPNRSLLEFVIWLFDKVRDCKSLKAWATFVIKALINLLYLPDNISIFDDVKLPKLFDGIDY